MLISLNWLREYVDFDVEPKQLAEDLTMIGLNVEGVEHQPNPFNDLRIGKVLTCEQHPNADRLSVCTVDIGEDEPRSIVCGAPNVKAGLEVPVIPAGGSMPDGTLIKKGKLRGVKSEGMICSGRELGISGDHDGIMALDYNAAPGTRLSQFHGSEDWVLDIEVTPNRPDQLGYLGVAREVAALYEGKLRLPAVAIADDSLADMPQIPVEIEDGEGCPRYIARRLRNVKVGPSPEWLCRRLESIGLRPINNVVDITNFVLFETGQPLHAFSAEKLAGGRIIVRRARQGETTITLEEKEVKLETGDVVIADEEKTVCIAGIMGSDNSRVADDCGEIVLESALFEPKSVRRTRSRLDISTDASYRFERGADFDMVAYASARTSALLAEVAGATVATSANDVIPVEPTPIVLELRLTKVNGLLGTSFSPEDVRDILTRLELKSEIKGESLLVDIPWFRRDLLIEVDLIEEVARLYGFDNIPSENRVSNLLHARLSPRERVIRRCHETLTGLGCQEVVTSSFMDEKSLDLMGIPESDERRQLVTLRNPLVSFNSMLRSSLLPGMLDVLKTNFHRGQDELRLYQIGRTYRRRDGEPLPAEREQVAALLTGHFSPNHWSVTDEELSLADIIGLVNGLTAAFRLDITLDFSDTDQFFVPGMSFKVLANGNSLGQGGLLKPSLLSDLKQKRDVFYLELMKLPAADLPGITCTPLPSYPASRRDLALMLPAHVQWRQVAEEVRKSGGKWLESFNLFDVYKGKGIPEGASSCAVRLVFRSNDGTLTDKQVDKQLKRMLGSLEHKLQVGLRS
ncbi:MAG: phenylalanine--tRNA ligase subunit beta [bacterium]|nr:phenylalanine--tRNA ligase subunit beta [bacterium]